MKYQTSVKDDCIGEYVIYIYHLERPVTEEMCAAMKKMGALKIFFDFPRPYFTIKAPGILIKGIVGEDKIEATYFDYSERLLQKGFESILSELQEEPC